MTRQSDVALVIGSGPNAPKATDWPRAWFDRIVVINNAWRIRPDWDDHIFPEDFPPLRRPAALRRGQRSVEAAAFVPAQNTYGGFVYAGGTMAFTAGYWALHALKPRVLAFVGCDMVYPASGPTHFYGTGAADPLRSDPTLQDLGAKSARLAVLAARDGCACVNLSQGPSALVFPRAVAGHLDDVRVPEADAPRIEALLRSEADLGYFVEDGRYWEEAERFDPAALASLDDAWRAAFKPLARRTHAA